MPQLYAIVAMPFSIALLVMYLTWYGSLSSQDKPKHKKQTKKKSEVNTATTINNPPEITEVCCC